MLNENEKLYFWSRIMKDHADFLLTKLSSKEIEYIKQAKCFKTQFSEILNDSKKTITNDFINRVMCLLIEFINFKRKILHELLTCNIELGFTPTFINHMINEAFEFYDDFQPSQNSIPINYVHKIIELHKKWLLDASGHATSIASSLDRVEKENIDIAMQYADEFNQLFVKASELGQMLERTELQNGSLQHLNEQVINKINEFIMFLDRLKTLTAQCKLLGILMPIVLDHMIREEEYYVVNIQRFNV